MTKEAYYKGIVKRAYSSVTVEPGVLFKILRGITSSSKGSKITRAILAGLPTAAIAKLLGAGWGTSAVLGAGAGTAAWYAPKLSKKYRLQQAARDKGVPAQVLDMVYHLDSDRFGDNPLDIVRRRAPKDEAKAIEYVRDLIERARNGKTNLRQISVLNSIAGNHKLNQMMLPKMRKELPPFNTDRLLAEIGALQTEDMFGPQNTGRTEAITELIKYK